MPDVRFMVISLIMVAPSFGQTFFLRIDGSHSSQWKRHHLELFEEYGFSEGLEAKGTLGFWDVPEDKARPQKGWLLMLGGDGQITRSYFRTIASQDAFKEDFAKTLNRMRSRFPQDPDKVRVTKTKGLYSIQVPAHSIRGGRSPAWEQHFRHEGALVVSSYGPLGRPGSNTVMDVPMQELVKWLRDARDKMTYVRYMPGNVERQQRSELVRSVFAAIAPRLQRRDVEPRDDYTGRRAGIEGGMKLFESLLLDVENAVYWERWPTGRQSYRSEFRMKAQPRSTLAAWLAGVGKGTQRGSLTDETTLAARADFSLPADIRPFARSAIEQGLSSVWGHALGQLVGEGRLDMQLWVSDRDGGPIIDMTAKTARSNAVAKDLLSTPHAIRFAGSEWHRTVESESNAVRVVLANGPSQVPKSRMDARASVSTRSRVLAWLKGDLSAWVRADEGDRRGELLAAAEEVYADLVIGPHPRRTRESLRSRANSNGDWSVEGTVKHHSGTLTATVAIGKDLHGFLLMQKQRIGVYSPN